jgi:hypothetical protein
MGEISYQGDSDRRENQRDVVSRTLNMLNFVSIGMIVLLGLLIGLAQPASYAVIDKRSGLSATWDPILCQSLFFVMIAGVFVGIAGLVLNAKRLKRKHDFLRVSLILLSLASLSGIVVYLVK